MGKQKLFNDPIYGLINFKFPFLYDLIDHPYFQRLRRIQQMGMAQLVYPGATHTRFQHAIGAMHLMQCAVVKLREKGIKISDAEAEASCAAMLLHDIGHGPISHALESKLIDVSHEKISLAIMNRLNEEFDGKLDLAIKIFKNQYSRPFLHQLVSGQLDLDRMDYITRDSFYTGVAEGTIGYDRIISMFNVVDDHIVIEEKAIFSVQKFLIAREIMYKQVYLHKTNVISELMLKLFFDYTKNNFKLIEKLTPGLLCSKSMRYFLEKPRNNLNIETLDQFLRLDDSDVWQLLKSCSESEDDFISNYANRLIKRDLFKIHTSDKPFSGDFKASLRQKNTKGLNLDNELDASFFIEHKEKIVTYSSESQGIKVLTKESEVVELSSIIPSFKYLTFIDTYFLCYPT